jgi:hypothetical protein
MIELVDQPHDDGVVEIRLQQRTRNEAVVGLDIREHAAADAVAARISASSKPATEVSGDGATMT